MYIFSMTYHHIKMTTRFIAPTILTLKKILYIICNLLIKITMRFILHLHDNDMRASNNDINYTPDINIRQSYQLGSYLCNGSRETAI